MSLDDLLPLLIAIDGDDDEPDPDTLAALRKINSQMQRLKWLLSSAEDDDCEDDGETKRLMRDFVQRVKSYTGQS